jgi:hypothetical protein
MVDNWLHDGVFEARRGRVSRTTHYSLPLRVYAVSSRDAEVCHGTSLAPCMQQYN